jgi:hypothetical protein
MGNKEKKERAAGVIRVYPRLYKPGGSLRVNVSELA